MIEFTLGTLGFKAPNNDVAKFTESFVKGEQETLYPLLFWMLEKQDVLKKRAYLARFLKNMEIPEEMFADNTIVSLFQEYNALQDTFKEVHQSVDAIRETSLKPQEIKVKMEQLTQEREQLKNKLNKLKERNQSVIEGTEFESIKKVTHLFRTEQEEESKIFQSLSEEKAKQMRAEQLYQQSRTKLRALQESDISRMEPQKLLGRLRDEVAAMKTKYNEQQHKEIQSREKALHDLEDFFSSDPLTEDQVRALSYETEELTRAVEDLNRKRDNLLSSADGQLTWYRDRASALEKKKEAMATALEDLEEDHKEAENDLRTIEAEIASLVKDGKAPKTDAQMKIFVKELAAKTELYKTKKQVIQSCRDEVAVLMKTEAILRTKDSNIQEFNQMQASRKGVEGYDQVQGDLEQVAGTNKATDTNKGEKLDEIGRVVTNITQTLKAKKNKLAPKIKELRAVRSHFEEVEEEYSKKKKIYDNMVLSLDSERLKLEQEVEANVAGILEEESTFHFLHCLSAITQARLDQMSAELQYTNAEGSLSSKHKTYAAMYESLISQQEERAKTLRQEKVTIKDAHGGNVQQRSMFLNLRKIMQCKIEMQKRAVLKGREEENNVVFGDGGGERLVID